MKTVRECESCKYETFLLNDDLKERKCKKCGGLMKIIMKEKGDEE